MIRIQIPLILVLLVCSATTFSQNNKPVLSIPAYNILYRGYLNEVEIGCQIPNLKISCQNLEMEQVKEALDPNKLSFILKPSTSSTARLIFIDSLSLDTIDVKEFRVVNLPSPEFNLKGLNKMNQISKSDLSSLDDLEIGYPEFFALDLKFEIISWEIKFEEKENTNSFVGKGSKITEEVKKKLANQEVGMKVSILVKYKGLDYEGFSGVYMRIVE